MKQNKIKILTLMAFIACNTWISGLYGQVTIGSHSSPEKAALLQLKNTETKTPSTVTGTDNITSDENGGGFGLPRVYLVNKKTLQPFIGLMDGDWDASNIDNTKIKHAGLMVYNIYVSKDDIANDGSADTQFRKGLYVWDGQQWRLEGEAAAHRYFYMPAFNLPLENITATGDPDVTYDLYKEYEWQFTKDDIDSPGTDRTTFVSNNNMIATVPSPANRVLYKRNELDYAVIYFDDSIIDVTKIDNNGVMSYRVIDNDPGPESFVNIIFIVKE